MVFENRMEAGTLLGMKLSSCKGKKDVLVLAIPRGGTETGYGLACEIGCPLDLVVSKKVPYPGQPELAIGAVCNDVVILDDALINASGISRRYVKNEVARVKEMASSRYRELSGKAAFPELKGKTVILTDDGIATGHTFLAAIDFLRGRSPQKIIAAIPVGHPESIELVRTKADETLVLESPSYFCAVGEFYRDFEQLSDGGVRKYVKLAGERHTK